MSSGDSSRWWLKEADQAAASEHGLNEREFAAVCEVFSGPPTMLELGICSALFSEHCSYKSTKHHLKKLPTDGPAVLQGPGENAGAVDIGEGMAAVFKIESHNHPSFIEPFQGAATGVGGILRDIFTMGARPVALMNALRFGMPSEKRTPYLVSRAVAGIGFYGNCMGIPTLAGEISFDKSYNGNCLVNAFALGTVKHDEIFRGYASGVGNPVVYVGSKTGRDGIHGATMASESFDDSSAAKLPTVQVGDPFQEKLLLEACLEAFRCGAVVGVQDMGAAGLTSSSFEMAERSETGMRLWLDKVPMRAEGMNPYELMLSESQERMLFVVEKGKESALHEICERWGLDSVVIGEVIEQEQVELHWHGELVSTVPMTLLAAVPELEREFVIREQLSRDVQLPKSREFGADLLKLVGSVNLCSRRPIFEQYDSSVRADSVFGPGANAGVVRVRKSELEPTKIALAMSADCNSAYCAIDAEQGAAQAVFESFRNITAHGARPLAISDCLNFGNPEKPEGMGEIVGALRGISRACSVLSAPVISGNVSLYNETNGVGVQPTPMIAMVGKLSLELPLVSSHFMAAGDRVFLLGEPTEQGLLGSSYLEEVLGEERAEVPTLNEALELKTAEFLLLLREKGLLKTCRDISSGGLASALTRCCLPEYENGIGVHIEKQSEVRDEAFLFSEATPQYLIAVPNERADELRQLASEHGLKLSAEGEVGGDKLEVASVLNLKISALKDVYSKGLAALAAGG